MLHVCCSQEVLYNGHYGGHGYKYQVVVSPCGLLEDVSGPYVGRTGDGRMVRLSRLNERLSEFCRFPDMYYPNFLVYGDPAYGRRTHIERPFDRQRADAQQRHINKAMARARVQVENGLGDIANTFPAMEFKRSERVGDTRVTIRFLVACILRNFLTCIRGTNSIATRMGVAVPTLRRFLRREGRPAFNHRLVHLRLDKL